MARERASLNNHKRIVALDALRGLAATLVAVSHFWMSTRPGSAIAEGTASICVEVFFLLSGFVLAPQILFCIKSNSLANLRVFLIRRWMRTLPPYVLALSISAILVHSLFSSSYFEYLFFVQNLFSIDNHHDFFAIAWSLSVEEWFYIIFPFYLMLASAFKYRISTSVYIFVGIALVIKLAGLFFDDHWLEFSRRLVMYRLDAIVYGFILFIAIEKFDSSLLQISYRFLLSVSCVSLIVVVALLSAIIKYKSALAQFAYFYAVALFAASMILTFISWESLFQKYSLAKNAAKIFGDISYDIYLFHLAAIICVQHILPNRFAAFFIFFFGLLAVSWCVRSFFERPILDARPSYQGSSTAPPHHHRRTIKYRALTGLATVLAIVICLEGISFTFITTLRRFRPDFFAVNYPDIANQLSDKQIKDRTGVFFVPALGWTFPPNWSFTSKNEVDQEFTQSTNARGSRSNPFIGGRTDQITIYGDSYGMSGSVNDDQTWQYYLSILTDVSVQNFSMGAYGTDQAVYRLERDLAEGYRSKVVILDIQSENIKNIMNAYRIFYNPNDGFLLGFKPVLVKSNNAWDWVIPKPSRPDSRENIRRSIEWAKKLDFFYQTNEMRPRDKFPYVFQAWRAIEYLVRMNGMGENELRRDALFTTFWKYPPAERRMLAIIGRFIQLSERYNFKPVIVFIPEPSEMLWYSQKNKPPAYRKLANEVIEQYREKGLVVVDVMSSQITLPKFNVGPFYGHPSAYGNRVIATAVAHALQHEDAIKLAEAPAGVPASASEVGVDPALLNYLSSNGKLLLQ
jgi:peptidoglycan/LPS O-acetylase OafA/YrhL